MASKVKSRRALFGRTELAAPRRFNGHWEYWFWDDTYRENIHVVWPVNNDLLTAYVNRRIQPKVPFVSGGSDHWGGRALSAIVDDNYHTVIAFRSFDGGPEDCACVAHESFHAACDILDARGADFCKGDGATNEHYAYLIERIYRVCHKAMASTIGKER